MEFDLYHLSGKTIIYFMELDIGYWTTEPWAHQLDHLVIVQSELENKT